VRENLSILLTQCTDMWSPIKQSSQAHSSLVKQADKKQWLCSSYLCWINNRAHTQEKLLQKERTVQCNTLSSWKQQGLMQKKRRHWSISGLQPLLC